jgi:hypothetical protein
LAFQLLIPLVNCIDDVSLDFQQNRHLSSGQDNQLRAKATGGCLLYLFYDIKSFPTCCISNNFKNLFLSTERVLKEKFFAVMHLKISRLKKNISSH